MKTLDYLHLDESAAGKLVRSLQQLLADFQVHYMNLRGFHWNIQGHGFFVLHSKFEEMYDDTAEKVDQIAERILMLGGVPSNKFSEYLKIAKVREIDGVSCGRRGSRPCARYLQVSDRSRARVARPSLGSGRRSDRLDDDRLSAGAGKDGMDAVRLLGSQAWRFLRPIASGLTIAEERRKCSFRRFFSGLSRGFFGMRDGEIFGTVSLRRKHSPSAPAGCA